MKKHVFALLALTVAGSAMAQNTITEAKGVVTAIDPTSNVLQSLKTGDVVKTGSTLSTTQSVTVRLEGGCTATLAAGQSMVVNATACEAFLAQAPRTVASGAGFGGGVFTPLNVGIGVASLATLRAIGRNNAAPAPISNN